VNPAVASLRYPDRVWGLSGWIVGLVVDIVAVGLAFRRSRRIDAGQVSASWLREQRAEKQERFLADRDSSPHGLL
jgi:hypothetical protein